MDFHDKYFTRNEIEERFRVLKEDKTFSEIDSRDIFHNQIPAKGILGCVIEQSVLEMKQNSLQEADLEIMQKNGEYKSTELKVTGVQPSNKENCKYEAKEPMSLTAVSIGTIEKETFLESHFYKKIAYMLWVFYVYDREPGQKVVPYKEYSRFKTLGYKFLDVADDKDELARFENDWILTQKYLIEAEKAEEPEELYPMLHKSIKDKLFYIDIAPRYKKIPKQTPRFRLKKSYVDTVFQEYFQSRDEKKLEKLPMDINSFSQLENRLHQLTETYRGKNVEELINLLGIETKKHSTKNQENVIPKHVTETIAVKMLGGMSKKISNIELFEKIGVIGKSIVITKKEKRTEDTKLFTLDLQEISDTNLEFEETGFYQYFSEHKLLCIIYEEPSQKTSLGSNVFLGFKWFTFSDELIDDTIRKVYSIVCDRFNNHTLVESYKFNKDGTIKINKTGVPSVALNLPKSEDYNIFIRGTSKDSTYKPWTFEGQAADGSNIIHTYTQQVWIKGSYLVNTLKDIDFI